MNRYKGKMGKRSLESGERNRKWAKMSLKLQIMGGFFVFLVFARQNLIFSVGLHRILIWPEIRQIFLPDIRLNIKN